MSDQIRCRCPRCTIRGLMGPAVLITIGVLFLLNEMRGDLFSFSNTIPFILIVIGAVQLAAATAPMTGHVDSVVPPPPPGPSATPGPAQNSMPGQGQ